MTLGLYGVTGHSFQYREHADPVSGTKYCTLSEFSCSLILPIFTVD